MKAYGCRAGQVDVNRSDKSRLALNSFPVVYFFPKTRILIMDLNVGENGKEKTSLVFR